MTNMHRVCLALITCAGLPGPSWLAAASYASAMEQATQEAGPAVIAAIAAHNPPLPPPHSQVLPATAPTAHRQAPHPKIAHTFEADPTVRQMIKYNQWVRRMSHINSAQRHIDSNMNAAAAHLFNNMNVVAQVSHNISSNISSVAQDQPRTKLPSIQPAPTADPTISLSDSVKGRARVLGTCTLAMFKKVMAVNPGQTWKAHVLAMAELAKTAPACGHCLIPCTASATAASYTACSKACLSTADTAEYIAADTDVPTARPSTITPTYTLSARFRAHGWGTKPPTAAPTKSAAAVIVVRNAGNYSKIAAVRTAHEQSPSHASTAAWSIALHVCLAVAVVVFLVFGFSVSYFTAQLYDVIIVVGFLLMSVMYGPPDPANMSKTEGSGPEGADRRKPTEASGPEGAEPRRKTTTFSKSECPA